MPAELEKEQTVKSSVWKRISLRTRLTAISVAVIGVLIAISLAGTTAFLRTYLQQNTDNSISAAAIVLANEDPTTVEERLANHELILPNLPNEYYIAFLDPQGRIYIGFVASTSTRENVPNLSQFNSIQVLETKGIPFTAPVKVNKQSETVNWRLVALPGPTGSVVVGVPLTQDEAIADQYQAIGFAFSGILLLISGLALWLTISTALRPLKEVSMAADSVRAGKLDSRLPELEGKTELAELNSSLNSMLDSVESSINQRNKTVDKMKQFVADASHELRTPLVTLRGYAELYRKGALKDKAQVDDAMQRIESEAIRMSELVESLLTLARLDNESRLHLAETDVTELTESVIANIRTAHRKAKISTSDLDGQPVQKLVWKIDDAAIKQVLTNLINNAYVFAGEKPIEVRLGNRENQLVIEVVDHGDGIPKQLRSKIFERFYRSDNSRNRDTGGSGLGLAIAKGLIEEHGGTIVADATAGGGATFRITIPNN